MTISRFGKILDIFDSPDSELTVWGENNQQDPSADSWASIMALLLHQMDITVGVFSFVRVPNGQKVKIFFSQHHHMIFRGQMQNLPTYFSNKKKYVFRRRKCGHNNNSRPHTRKVSFYKPFSSIYVLRIYWKLCLWSTFQKLLLPGCLELKHFSWSYVQ